MIETVVEDMGVVEEIEEVGGTGIGHVTGHLTDTGGVVRETEIETETGLVDQLLGGEEVDQAGMTLAYSVPTHMYTYTYLCVE